MGKVCDAAYMAEVCKRVVEGGETVPSVGRELGISENTLYTWVSRYRKNGVTPFVGSGNIKPNPFRNNKNAWGSASVMNILKNPAYYGAMSNGKRAVTSFKNKRIVCKSFDDWVIVEGTHESLITKEQFDEAQRIGSKNKRETVRRSADGEVSIFAGIVKCADCGGNMIFNRKVYKSYTKEFFRCSTYAQKGKAVCPPHVIDYDVLYQAVLTDIQRYATLAIEDGKKLIDRILRANDEFKNKNLQRYEKSIRESRNRTREIDGLLQSLFEEKLSGNISDTIFKRMAQKYEDEQKKLIIDLEQTETELDKCQHVQQDLTGWIARIKECLTIDTLTRAIAVELIDSIQISETYDKDGEKTINLENFYKFGLKNVSHDEAKENRASRKPTVQSDFQESPILYDCNIPVGY